MVDLQIATPVARLKSVSLAGRDEARLRDVSLTLSSGVTAVMGASGAGKTSLLNLLAGYERPSAGTLTCDRKVTWVPSGLGLWPGYTVAEHLEVPCPELLEALDLHDCANALPSTLSLGQRARVAVARAVSSSAQLLIMDEPLAHVDPRRRPGYWKVIRHYLRDRALVFASHEPETVLAHAEQVVCLINGTLSYQGDVCSLYDEPGSEALAHFLGRTNWLDVEAQRSWFGKMFVSAAVSIRPEQLEINVSAKGGVRCVEYTSLGLYAESTLRRESSGEERAFLHRSTMASSLVGQLVALRWVPLLMMFCLSVMSCEKQEGYPVIPVTSVSSWALPIDGPKLPSPRSVATGLRDEVIVLDDAGRVLVFGKDGDLLRRWSMPEVSIGRPEGVVVLDNGEIVVCDTHYSQILVFDEMGTVLRQFGRDGRGAGEFIYPVAIARDAQNHLYIGEYGSNDRIQKFTSEGEHLVTFGSFGTEAGQFQRPSGIVWHEGLVYVADAVNNRIQVFSEDGKFERILEIAHHGEIVPLHLPYDLVLDGKGQLIVVEYGAGRVLQCSRQGEMIGVYGRQGSGSGQFHTPWGVTVDSRGHLRVADTGNRRLVAITVDP